MGISQYKLRFQLFWQYFKQKILRRKFRPVESLDADVLGKIQAEASFLRDNYGVEVRRLSTGETPDIPKPADSAKPH